MNKKKVREIDDKLNEKVNFKIDQIQWYLGRIVEATRDIDYSKKMVEELIYLIQEEIEE
jgi:hypothetical protein